MKPPPAVVIVMSIACAPRRKHSPGLLVPATVQSTIRVPLGKKTTPPSLHPETARHETASNVFQLTRAAFRSLLHAARGRGGANVGFECARGPCVLPHGRRVATIRRGRLFRVGALV